MSGCAPVGDPVAACTTTAVPVAPGSQSIGIRACRLRTEKIEAPRFDAPAGLIQVNQANATNTLPSGQRIRMAVGCKTTRDP